MGLYRVLGLGILFTMVLAACGGSGGGGGVNVAPTADAGADQDVANGAAVTLSGMAADTDGTVVSVAWTQTGGSAVALTGGATDTATFTAAAVGSETLTFEFSATDDGGLTSSDTMLVRVGAASFVVYIAEVIAGVQELFRADLAAGAPAPVKLSAPLVAGGNVTHFTISPDGSKVAYRADQDTDLTFEIYIANSDGSGTPVKANGPLQAGGQVYLLTGLNQAGLLSNRSWSPDGTRLAYWGTQDAAVSELFTSRSDGTDNRKVNGPIAAGGGVEFSSIEWAPDGSRLAYVADQDVVGKNEIYTSLPDGTGNVKLNGPLPANANVLDAVGWAPDSSRVAFLAMGTGASQDNTTLHTSPAAGGGSAEVSGTLVARDEVENGFRWAPDSSRLAFMINHDFRSIDGFTVPAAGGTRANLHTPFPTNSGKLVWNFAWAPDSSRVAYAANQDSQSVDELYTSLPTGASNVRVNHALGGGDVGTLSWFWAPDSTKILYDVNQSGMRSRLYTAGPTGAAAVELHADLPLDGSIGPGQWAPDSSRIVYSARELPGGSFELYAILPDNTGRVKLSGPLTAGGHVTDRCFTSDSSQVVYRADANTDGVFEVFVAPSDGSAAARQISQAAIGAGVRNEIALWSPPLP